MLAGQSAPVSNELMNFLNGWSFFRERSDMHDLGGPSLMIILKPNFPNGGRVLLFSHFSNGNIHHFHGDEVRLHDHHCPLPGIPVFHKFCHVVRPPQPFQRHDTVINRLGAFLDHELQGVGYRVQGFHGIHISPGMIGITHSIHH